MATYREAQRHVEWGFWIHLGCYVIVVTGLAILNVVRNPDNPWFPWVAGGWGMGIAAHGIAYSLSASHHRMVERTKARLDWREYRHSHRER